MIKQRRTERRATSRRISAASTTDDIDNNITLVMIIVVLVFMITQAPARIVQLIWEYKFNHCSSVQFVLIEISKVVEVINSSVNFFIYCGLRSKFRNAIHTNTNGCCGKVRDQGDGQYHVINISAPVENGPTTKILMETHDL